MALPFTETFGGSENPLADHWTSMPTDGSVFAGSFKEDGTHGLATTANENVGSYVDDETFQADQYAEFDLSTSDSTFQVGNILRRDSASGDCYLAHVRPAAANARVYVQFYDLSGGTFTSIGPASYETIVGGITSGHEIRFEISGANPGTVVPYMDDVQLGDDVWDDSEIDGAGPTGLYALWDDTTTQLMAEFRTGNLGAPPAGTAYTPLMLMGVGW